MAPMRRFLTWLLSLLNDRSSLCGKCTDRTECDDCQGMIAW
jgi:hypothetical protein